MPDLLQTIVGLFVVTIVAIAVVLPTIGTQISALTSTTSVSETLLVDNYNVGTNLVNRNIVPGTLVLTNFTGGLALTLGTDYTSTNGDAVTLGTVNYIRSGSNVSTSNVAAVTVQNIATNSVITSQGHSARNANAYNASVFNNILTSTLVLNVTNASVAASASSGNLKVTVNGFQVGWIAIPAANTSSLTTFTNVSGAWFDKNVAANITLANVTDTATYWTLNSTVLTTVGGPKATAAYQYYQSGYVGSTIGTMLQLIPLLIGLAILLLYVGIIGA